MLEIPLRRLAGGLGLILLPCGALAECQGTDLLAQMPAEESAALARAADAVPFARGNYWIAERGKDRVTLIGTYHLDDPRHARALDRFSPDIAAADALLVEAGPDEEKALVERMARDPSALTITDGPSLLQILPDETWTRLQDAAAARGIPGFMVAKFRPWYVTVLLSIPPCALSETAQPRGLDGQLIEAAQEAGVPVRALEPYDTVLSIFAGMTEAEQIEMIEQSLALEDRISDFSTTLAEAYFRGENRLMWELMRKESYAMPGYSPERVDAEMAMLEERMMTRRNESWIPVIEAAASKGPIVVAFGALHLSGEKGVLNLLAQDGWIITPVALP